jgi:NTE family protein
MALLRLPAALALAACLCAAPAAAQEQPLGPAHASRPRIGLALGGGSARGLAHVGVLEWLHEHRIPIDAVAGTSIGGLIGGSYATGMTEGQIRAMTEGTDWDAVLSADAPFKDKTFRRKQDRRAFPAKLEFGVRHGLWLPRSLNPGQRVALLFDRLTLPYSALDSFDDLPTPFHCVAFDINRSETVVLDRGVLSAAMRATMALPGLFPPVVIDGRLLVDGGFQDNVPADVARQMGVDVVIAVDVGRRPGDDPDVTAFSMLSRTVDALMASGTRRSLESADIVIRPDISRLTGIDWNEASEWRDRGYRAAGANAAALLAYSVTPEEYAAHEAARMARRRLDPIVPSAVVVTGGIAADQSEIASQLHARAGRPLDLDRLSKDLLLLSGTDRYDLLTYHLANSADGPRLVVNARLKPNGPAFLSLGAEVNNVDASNFALNLLGRTTVYDVFGRGSEVRLDFALGTRQGAAAELYRPFLARWLFAAPRTYVQHSTRNLFETDRLVAEYGNTRAGAGIDLGIATGRRAEFRVGGDLVHAHDGLRVGDPQLPEGDGWERTAGAQFTFDGQDSPVVPTQGLYARARIRRFFSAPAAVASPSVVRSVEAPPDFYQAEFDATAFHSVTDRNRVFLRAAGGTSFDAHPYFYDFSLGGPFRMSAFSNDELRGAHYGFLGGGYMRQLPRLPAWVGGHAYLAAWVEAGSAFDSRAAADWNVDVAAGLIIDSLIGPIFVGGGAGPDGHHRLYVSIGTMFR